MKKRILAMAFAVMMAFGVAACGGAEKDEHEGHDHDNEDEAEETTKAEAEETTVAEETTAEKAE